MNNNLKNENLDNNMIDTTKPKEANNEKQSTSMRIKVYGRELVLTTDKGDEFAKRLETYINKKISEVTNSDTKTVNKEQMYLLLALDIANDYIIKSYDEYSRTEMEKNLTKANLENKNTQTRNKILKKENEEQEKTISKLKEEVRDLELEVYHLKQDSDTQKKD